MVRNSDAPDQLDYQPDQSNDSVGVKPTKTKQVDITALEIDMEHHIFIGGITQSGKSYLMKHLFERIKTQGRKCIFFDYKNDPDHVKWIKRNDYPVFRTIEGIKRYWSKPLKILKTFRKKPISNKIVYRPKRPKGFGGAFNLLEELSDYTFRRGNMILFIDEIAPLTDGRKIPASFYDCLIMGASRGVTVVSVSQRPKDIHNIILSESYTKLLFRLNLEDDRKKIKGIAGQEVADGLFNLPNKYFYYVRADGYYEICTLKADKKG